VEHINHLSHGLLTPAFGYLVMCMAAVIGLRCTVRALTTSGKSKRMWLFVGATAIAAGIWTLHFIAMIGFGVMGSAIRYNVPLTLISLVLAIAVVSAGVFTVGYGRARGLALFVGGLGMGLGVATMHYSGMAAVQLNGNIQYNPTLVIMSVIIAVTAATAALWIVLNVTGLSGTMIAALVMGLAVSSMHYTAMAAVSVEVEGQSTPLPGATAMEFLFPLSIGIGAILFIAFTIVAVSPLDDDEDDEMNRKLQTLQARRAAYNDQLEAQISAADRHPSVRRRPAQRTGNRPTR
jgi:NO-binding membrane sensor protein with MHYT domain